MPFLAQNLMKPVASVEQIDGRPVLALSLYLRRGSRHPDPQLSFDACASYQTQHQAVRYSATRHCLIDPKPALSPTLRGFRRRTSVRSAGASVSIFGHTQSVIHFILASPVQIFLHVMQGSHPYPNTRAAGFAKYVNIMLAPARVIDVSVSIMARSWSIHPLRAAATIMEYSPLTWYAAMGTSNRSRACRIRSR